MTMTFEILPFKPAASYIPLVTEIDRLVYALYNLTDEEIAAVEGKK